ncbi:hypothetical protein MMC26_001614 [Xylographa opegraphella]|nr:hypothetical protein [Xylographa opegraphella]
MSVNYSLYLVTDSTDGILGQRNLVKVVEEALQGGVTIVQYRDKTSDTADLIRTANLLHAVTQKHGVPLLINDRVDVALAVDAEGVHIGQDDMDLATARKLLGPSAIIGVTCSSVGEAHAATLGGANYLGIGTMFATPTKQNTKSIIGTAGTRMILEHLAAITELPHRVSTVAIGGINASNVQRVMYQSKSTFRGLDGVAVVSAIIAAQSPKDAAAHLLELIKSPPPFVGPLTKKVKARTAEDMIRNVQNVVKQVGIVVPVCHNMTNTVVQNFAANVAVAIGASPCMANDAAEAGDLAKLGGGLVVNMGTPTLDGVSNYIQAVQAYNSCGGPVLLDPVGAGGSGLRREAVKRLMAGGYFDVIKGNEFEIGVVWGFSKSQQRGVDSGKSDTTLIEKARIVKKLAARERNVVIMTGAVDVISDGDRTFLVRNGPKMLSQITGSGCTLGTTVAAFVAVEKEDKLLAALAGMLLFEIAAEVAAVRPDVKGPGTFIPAFIDALTSIADQAHVDDSRWLGSAKVEAVDAA